MHRLILAADDGARLTGDLVFVAGYHHLDLSLAPFVEFSRADKTQVLVNAVAELEVARRLSPEIL